MKRNLLRLSVIVILLCQWFAPIYASNNVENSIFEGIEKTDDFQKKLITIDAFRETNNIYEHLPNLCVRAFLKAIEPRWHNRDSTLVFFAPSMLLKMQLSEAKGSTSFKCTKKSKGFPFNLYPPYRNVNWKQLLLSNYLLIQVGCIMRKNSFVVELYATIKPDKGKYVYLGMIHYEFFLFYKPAGKTKGFQTLDTQKFRQQLVENTDELISEDGKLFQDIADKFYWQIAYVTIPPPHREEYVEVFDNQECIFDYWDDLF